MNEAALEHRMDSEFAYMLEDGRIVIRVRTARDDVTTVTLYHRDQFGFVYDWCTSVPCVMNKALSDSRHDYWEACVGPMSDVPLLCYYFEFVSNSPGASSSRYLGDYRLYPVHPTEGTDMFYFFPQTPADVCTVPDWARHAVVYQIFPDRFAIGSDGPRPDYDVLPWHAHGGDDRLLGGTLNGIRERLEYLENLGVSCLYLTPVFASDTAHKYNTFDYYRIDPQFGTNTDLKELVQAAHERDMRVILDGVFNHCGIGFFAFQDLLKNHDESEYRDWFRVRSFPISTEDRGSYECFGYLPYMPKLATDHEPVFDYLIEVATYWIREADIDGWRLDCAPEVDHRFWRAFRDAVKREKADALLVGEFWHDARTWLSGDQIDSSLNYTIMLALEDWMIGGTVDASAVVSRLDLQRALYRRQTLSVLWNLIGSHDTDRFFSKCNRNIGLMKIAVVLLVTYPGVPVIYYGDEIGMGGRDPYHREGMKWGDAHKGNELLAFYTELLEIYKSQPAFATEGIEFLTHYVEHNALAFVRGEGTSGKIAVVLNPGGVAIPMCGRLADSEILMETPSKTEECEHHHEKWVPPESAMVLRCI